MGKKPGGAKAPFTLPELPFARDALEPHISSRTLEFHYGKHHRGYIDKTNKAVKGTAYANDSLVSIIQKTAGKAEARNIFNNAAQAWNHTFYWNGMKPGGGGQPGGALMEQIKQDFGSFDNFKKEMAAAAGVFGSGWGWLVADKGRLATMSTSNADNPIAHGRTPILVVDVWEHAYYLDYQNRRGAYVEAWLDNLVNWDFAAENFRAA
ncbi:MAG: superoxide dismutase [Desulfatibacillaceae bacterium]